MQLLIANKNYSSWSMRPWLVLKAFNLPFDEVMIVFSDEPYAGEFKQKVLAVNPNGKVPILLDQEQMVWDSLAICEYLAEKFPQHALWPADLALRVRARCISAEMHSGFMSLRSQCGMNIHADLKALGAKLWAEDESLRKDMARIEQIWTARPRLDGFLCGEFSIADAFYAPVVMRLNTYGLPVSDSAQRYMALMIAHPAVQQWMQEAVAEPMRVAYLEANP
ncbi:glutathione S-transferase family protein [Acinetobacter pragensis]|uniref:Glutathione S-transferase n=1 Tax=Acinetobacter pragensis TaxID=1806892 RepID=A0A151Y2S2_9GAMM|nr:glutathione S-transferase family protein [Acinetobacter pragensis]KYQ72318.1 glutathione S-transferase [Acinetobacter pragensis]